MYKLCDLLSKVKKKINKKKLEKSNLFAFK